MAYTPRRKKLIDKSLQLRLVGAFLAVASIAVLFQVVLMNNSMLSLSRSLGEGGEELLRQAPTHLARTILLTLAVLIPVTATVGIIVTHRIAGPAYRMRMYLEEIARDGAPEAPCRIRKNDELQDLCAKLNLAIEAIQTTHVIARKIDDFQLAGPQLIEQGATSGTIVHL